MKLTLTLLAVLLLAWSDGAAQINLKQKLSKKADQEIDKFLFGQKDEKKSDTEEYDQNPSETSSDEVSEDYEPSESTDDPLGGYTRQPVDYGTISAGEVVGFRDLINFLPDEAGTYRISEKPEGSTARYGEYRYSTAQKTYESGEEQLQMSIFDYMQTGMLLAGYANQYEYESTDGIMKSVEVKGQPGWYSANYASGETSLFLVVKDRFLISIQGENIDQETLTGYASTMEIDQLPEAPPVPEEESGE